ncbi:hypothetical protein GTR04_5699 [Trichophyton interdigitale]|nr:hypothetical protein GTR04_5699 [Trichophyton interdigitale]
MGREDAGSCRGEEENLLGVIFLSSKRSSNIFPEKQCLHGRHRVKSRKLVHRSATNGDQGMAAVPSKAVNGHVSATLKGSNLNSGYKYQGIAARIPLRDVPGAAVIWYLVGLFEASHESPPSSTHATN